MLEARAHTRKLPRGALAGQSLPSWCCANSKIDVQVPSPAQVALMAARGLPNYFGPQRFGRDAANLEAVDAWLAGAGLPRGRDAPGSCSPAARSLLFNAVLAARVGEDMWDRLAARRTRQSRRQQHGVRGRRGRSMLLLEARLAAGDIHPTGPMWGTDAAEPSARATRCRGRCARSRWRSRRAARCSVGRRRGRPASAAPRGQRDLVFTHLEARGRILCSSSRCARGAYATTAARHEMVETDSAR